MLPFLFGIVWALFKLGERWGAGAWLLPLVLLDPVLAGQMAGISPDVALACFFLVAVESIFSDRKWLLATAVLGLCLISMRGMITAAALLSWVLLIEWQQYPKGFRAIVSVGIQRSIPFFPGFFMAILFLAWHRSATGWIGHHPDSPWQQAFQTVGWPGFLKNIAVLGWRWLDFGRVGEWLFVAVSLWYFKGKTLSPKLLCLLFCLIFWLSPTTLIYQNLSAHRYFLPAFLGFHLFVFHLSREVPHRALVRSLLIAMLALGNLWQYPVGIAMGWDATLAHLPYHDLRHKAIDFLKQKKIPLERVGTAFPNLNTLENTDLNGDTSCFAAINWKENDYILWSNVFNDFSKADLEDLEKNWSKELDLENYGVSIRIYRRQE